MEWLFLFSGKVLCDLFRFSSKIRLHFRILRIKIVEIKITLSDIFCDEYYLYCNIKTSLITPLLLSSDEKMLVCLITQFLNLKYG